MRRRARQDRVPALAADRLLADPPRRRRPRRARGAASLWTWDHLMLDRRAVAGPDPRGLVGPLRLGRVTERATLGLMVGANTFRNPGLTAKLATTLDHLSRTAARSSASAAPGSSASTRPSGSTSAAASASGSTGSTSR